MWGLADPISSGALGTRESRMKREEEAGLRIRAGYHAVLAVNGGARSALASLRAGFAH